MRESLFLLPALVVIGFAVMAWGLVWLDNNTDALAKLPLLPTTVASARAVLSTIAGATITVAAIVFSITALTVQLASSQYSPRILGVLFRDTFQQLVIGVVTGTFVFSLLVLASVRLPLEGDQEVSPSAATTFAIVMAVVSMLAIVAFLSHVLQRIRIDTIVRRIADSTTHEFRRLLPERLESTEKQSLAADALGEADSTTVRSRRSGWVVDIDDLALLEAVEESGVVRLDVEVGEFVYNGTVLATIWRPSPGLDAESAVRGAIGLGIHRRIEGDPGFGLRLLADIALRALSPGINDPATAVDVVSHLGEPLGEILTRDLPQRVHSDEAGRRLFRPLRPDRVDYIRSALREIRLNASRQPEVIIAIIDLVGDLISILGGDQQSRADPLLAEIGLLMEAADDELPPPDALALRHRAEKKRLIPSSSP
jgi:uncharacterized membrane protein